MNIKVIVPLLFGVALGIAGATVYLVNHQTASAPLAVTPIESHESAPVVSETATRDRERIAKLEADNEKLLARLQAVTASNEVMKATISTSASSKPKEVVNPFAAMFGGGEDGTNAMAGAMQKLIKGQLDQQLEAKMSRMKAKLQLTPEQEAQIRETLTKANDQALAMTEKMYSGKAKAEDLKEASSLEAAAPKAIEELLTPEQKTEYAAMQKEEQQGNARLMANAEMLQTQNSLGLTQEQQDKVFGVLYQQTLDTTSAAATENKSDPVVTMEKAIERKVEALRGVLTDEQLKSYRDLQEQQLKLIQAFIPKTGDPAPPAAVILTKP
jgi:hypothetical protein